MPSTSFVGRESSLRRAPLRRRLDPGWWRQAVPNPRGASLDRKVLNVPANGYMLCVRMDTDELSCYDG